MSKKFKAGSQSFWGLVYFQFILFRVRSASWSQLEAWVFSGPFLLFRFYTIIFFLPFMTGKLLKALFSFSVLLLFSETVIICRVKFPQTSDSLFWAFIFFQILNQQILTVLVAFQCLQIGVLKVMTDVVLKDVERQRGLPYPKPHHSSWVLRLWKDSDTAPR